MTKTFHFVHICAPFLIHRIVGEILDEVVDEVLDV